MGQKEHAIGRFEGVPARVVASWDIGAISHALRQEPAPTRDIAHGPGVRYALAEGALTVDLFPPHPERASGIVRLSTSDSLQEFYRQPQPAVRDEGLIFETQELLISLSPAGEVMTYRLVPDAGPQEPPDGDDDAERTNSPSSDDSGPERASGAARNGYQQALPESGKQPRVSYGGRLGAHPRSKTTPSGKYVMEFPVAVRVENQERPDWKNTVVFDQKARALDGQLSKGTYVDVVAYEHRTLRQDAKTGKSKERTEYYATSVTPKPRNERSEPGATGERHQ